MEYGGKFLINCLGLGNNAVMQERNLARLQLDGKLSVANKFDNLIQRLENIGNKWNDLGLGCGQYFGGVYNYYPHSTPSTKNFYPEVAEVFNRGWYAFLVSHNLADYKIRKTIWPNHRCINFQCSSDRFFSTYRSNRKIVQYWKTIRGASWPVECPLTKEEINQLPSFVTDELVGRFNGGIFNFVVDHSESPEDVLWDTDWYLTESDTVDNVKRLYKHFDITDFNPDLIVKYRNAWLDVLTRLNNNFGKTDLKSR